MLAADRSESSFPKGADSVAANLDDVEALDR